MGHVRSDPKAAMTASVKGSVPAKWYDDPKLQRGTDNGVRGLQYDPIANRRDGQTPSKIVDRRH
jgi:hypothetical protein